MYSNVAIEILACKILSRTLEARTYTTQFFCYKEKHDRHRFEIISTFNKSKNGILQGTPRVWQVYNWLPQWA